MRFYLDSRWLRSTFVLIAVNTFGKALKRHVVAGTYAARGHGRHGRALNNIPGVMFFLNPMSHLQNSCGASNFSS